MPYFFLGHSVVDRRACWKPRLTDAIKMLNTCPSSDHAPAQLDRSCNRWHAHSYQEATVSSAVLCKEKMVRSLS